MKLNALITLCVLLITPLAIAAPVINRTSGTLENGQTLTITGAGFGSKNYAEPMITSYDSAVTPANKFSSGSIGGDWTTGGSLSLITTALRSTWPQSSYKLSYEIADTPYNSIRRNWGVAEDKIFGSFWHYRDNATANFVGSNNKFLRIYQSADPGTDGNFVLSAKSTLDSYASGDNIGTNNYTIAYTACSASEGSGDVFNANSTACKPTMQQWDHWQFYIDYPSGLGAGDATVILWLNGKTHSRSTSVSLNEGGQTNDRRHFLIGQPSGDANPTYNEYLDQIYLDTTVAHVFLSDSASVTWPDFGSYHHSEIQVASSWGASSIDITVNAGSFVPCAPVYLYVVDSSGAISSAYGPIDMGADCGSAPTGGSGTIGLGGSGSIGF